MNRSFLVRDERAGVIVSNYVSPLITQDRINYEKALEILSFSETKRRMMPHEFLFTLGVLSTKFVAQLFFKNIDTSTFRGISVGIQSSR
jgi:hypothetical protein